MEVIQNYVPTSKAQLIQVAMFMNNGDVKKAQEFFDFYSKNLELPDFTPTPPTVMQQVKSFFSWAKENQGDLVQGYQFIQSIIKNKGDIIGSPLPSEGSPLPPINE